MNKCEIRIARPEDAEAILSIYAPYIEKTAITFEYDVPDIDEFRNRIIHTLEKYPYIVAFAEGKMVGYAYVSTFHERKAYDWAVETSIYVDEKCKGRGYGGEIHEALEKILSMQNILNLNACIAYTNDLKDPYLTNDSCYFHEHLGYRLVGQFSQCGFKFKRWYDMIWMEKLIGEHHDHPGDLKLIEEIKDEVEAYLQSR